MSAINAECLSVTNAECLCKDAQGNKCDYVGTTKSISFHLRSNHNVGQHRDLTYRKTDKPLNFRHHRHRNNVHYGRGHSKQKEETGYIDVPCIMRIDVLTERRTIILGGSE